MRLLLLLASTVLFAQSPNTLSREEKAAGWILLFDGKTMKGWDDPTRKSPPGDAWSIVDGCLRATPKPRLREDLVSQRTFGDFELVFDWKIAPGANSGVKYRIQDRVLLVKGKTKPGANRFEETVDYELEQRLGRRNKIGPDDHVEDYPIAFEYQTIDATHADARRGGKQTAGALYSMVAPSVAAAKPAGEWNQARVVLRGNHVEHWLNGQKVVDTDLYTPEIAASLEQRWGKSSPVYQLLTKQPRRNAPIGLQNHNDEAWFRNIRIRPL